jgi:hypothetical protein
MVHCQCVPQRSRRHNPLDILAATVVALCDYLLVSAMRGALLPRSASKRLACPYCPSIRRFAREAPHSQRQSHEAVLYSFTVLTSWRKNCTGNGTVWRAGNCSGRVQQIPQRTSHVGVSDERFTSISRRQNVNAKRVSQDDEHGCSRFGIPRPHR